MRKKIGQWLFNFQHYYIDVCGALKWLNPGGLSVMKEKLYEKLQYKITHHKSARTNRA